MQAAPELLSRHACFGGEQRFYRHDSATIGLAMRFGLYLPPQALGPSPTPVPVLIYLAGLTCTEETFAIKAGAQRWAAELGLDDAFLDSQLHPAHFEAACTRIGQPLTLRRHAGYDHGYYFISTFVQDHLEHHGRALATSPA